MKINSIGNYSNYNFNKPVKNEKIKNTKNYDVIEINKATKNEVNNEGISIQKLKTSIVEEVNKDLSDEQINAFREKIQNGEYKIDSKELAKIILDM